MKDPIIHNSLALGHSIVIFEVCRDLIHPIVVLLWIAFPMRSQKISVLVGSQRTGVCCLRVVACPAWVARDLLLEFRGQPLVPGQVTRVPAVGHRGQGIPAVRSVYHKSSGGGALMQREMLLWYGMGLCHTRPVRHCMMMTGSWGRDRSLWQRQLGICGIRCQGISSIWPSTGGTSSLCWMRAIIGHRGMLGGWGIVRVGRIIAGLERSSTNQVRHRYLHCTMIFALLIHV